ncbi:hypothetical protein BpHYR1_035882 [Brachionus plicatilis]|uniref:Uncharacterized protein n=1 Tax=Brachionus plicatilis TaxID=10195 RepID=A0A3M7QUY6_BRAPC|nr:hypothetical protein BpHYR1_035882 [Brachionus plicatilis]
MNCSSFCDVIGLSFHTIDINYKIVGKNYCQLTKNNAFFDLNRIQNCDGVDAAFCKLIAADPLVDTGEQEDELFGELFELMLIS